MSQQINLAGCIYSRKCIYSQGAIEGLFAGLVLAAAEMLMSLFMGGHLLEPLWFSASIVLGPAALKSGYPPFILDAVGLAVHAILSIAFGVTFMFLLKSLQLNRANRAQLLTYSSVYGFLLWAVNFYIIAPIAFPQFTLVDEFWPGFTAHTFFYGTALGYYLWYSRKGS